MVTPLRARPPVGLRCHIGALPRVGGWGREVGVSRVSEHPHENRGPCLTAKSRISSPEPAQSAHFHWRRGGGAYQPENPPPPRRNAELLHLCTSGRQYKAQEENWLISGLKTIGTFLSKERHIDASPPPPPPRIWP